MHEVVQIYSNFFVLLLLFFLLAGACHRIYNRASPVSRCSCTPASASAQLSSPASSRR